MGGEIRGNQSGTYTGGLGFNPLKTILSNEEKIVLLYCGTINCIAKFNLNGPITYNI